MSKMTFGKHKGAKYEDVPASYFLWMLKKFDKFHDKELEDYIKTNKTDLEERAELEERD